MSRITWIDGDGGRHKTRSHPHPWKWMTEYPKGGSKYRFYRSREKKFYRE